MKRIKIVIILFLSLFIFSPVYAETCDSEDINRLTDLAEHVDIAYKVVDPYSIHGDYGEMEIVNDDYNLLFSNLTEEIYITLINYDYDDVFVTNNQNEKNRIKPGLYQVKFFSVNCNKELLRKELMLPYYNIYSEEDICKDVDNNVCKKWVTKKITQSEFKTEQKKYEEKNKNKKSKYLEFIIDNIDYIGICLAFILALAIVIIIKTKNKRNELK